MRLPVELHDAAFSEVHQLGKLQRRAAHLDREAERNVREQAIVAALEAGFALILADRDFVDFTHVSSSLRPSRSERSEEHTSELQSLMRISYAVFCLKKKNK